MDGTFKGKFVVVITLVFFVFFTFYAFSSSDKINNSPTILGPVMRSLVVGIWLIIALFSHRKKWHLYSAINILTGVFAPQLLLFIFGYQFDYAFSIFSYCFISTISAMTNSNLPKCVGIWVGVFVVQIIVDLCFAISGLYGSFSMS